jgi:hypothetical protein
MLLLLNGSPSVPFSTTPVGLLLLLTRAIEAVAAEGISPEVKYIIGRAHHKTMIIGQSHDKSIVGVAKFPLRRTA